MPENNSTKQVQTLETRTPSHRRAWFSQKPSPIGLSISDASIEAVQFSGTPDKHNLLALSRKKLAHDVVSNGEVLKREELALALTELFQAPRHGTFTTGEVIFALPESKTFAHIFQIQRGLSLELLQKTVAEEAQKAIPFPQDALYADSLTVAEKNNVSEVLYVAAEKRIVDGFLEAIAAADLSVAACDMESLALSRSLIQKQEPRATTIVDIGSRTTIVSIFEQGILRFSENIPIAGDAFSEAIRLKREIDTREAEELKRRFGIEESKEGQDILKSVEPLLEKIGERILEAHRYYEKQSGHAVNDVVLAGGSSLMAGLDTWLKDFLDLPVRKGAVEAPIFFATAIGLAKRGLTSRKEKLYMNLLPKEEQRSLYQKAAAFFLRQNT